MKPANRTEQRGSSLLSREENEQIFSLLGERCQTLSTTVVQLFSTDAPDGTQWIKKDAGILCLVRDPIRRSYFFRIFCLSRKSLVWEHEVYNGMRYLSPKPFFHTFEGEECIVAFNFANDIEAANLRSALLEKLKTKEQMRLERRCRSNRSNNSHRDAAHRSSERQKPAPAIPSSGSPSSSPVFNSLPAGKKQKKNQSCGRITKADIGLPLNFKHVTHVGWNPNTGFEMENVNDPQWREFFDKAGVSESHLRDRETREFIYDFIERHGGLDAVKEDINPAPTATPTVTPTPPTPPPIPARSVPPAITRTAPAPPPPSSTNSPPPPIPRHVRSQNVSRIIPNAPPPPPLSTIPAPPADGPPPPPLPSMPIPATADPRTELMNAIRSGTTLKRVNATESKANATANLNADGTRVELLNQIRQGVELKAVQPAQKSPQNTIMRDGLAGALAAALAERSKAIHSDSSDTSESEDDYDEWED